MPVDALPSVLSAPPPTPTAPSSFSYLRAFFPPHLHISSSLPTSPLAVPSPAQLPSFLHSATLPSVPSPHLLHFASLPRLVAVLASLLFLHVSRTQQEPLRRCPSLGPVSTPHRQSQAPFPQVHHRSAMPQTRARRHDTRSKGAKTADSTGERDGQRHWSSFVRRWCDEARTAGRDQLKTGSKVIGAQPMSERAGG